MKQLAMAHDVDPKEKLLSELGDLSSIEVFNNQVLLATYIRPEKTKSGLYLSDKYRDEDRFQSKVGLIIGLGPDAFADESGQWFKDTAFNLHDWVVHRPSDGLSMTINGVLCRLVTDTQIKMRTQSPDTVW
jgi:co-chaperonin GroES (HSP10)